jgi:hypothetical protein
MDSDGDSEDDSQASHHEADSEDDSQGSHQEADSDRQGSNQKASSSKPDEFRTVCNSDQGEYRYVRMQTGRADKYQSLQLLSKKCGCTQSCLQRIAESPQLDGIRCRYLGLSGMGSCNNTKKLCVATDMLSSLETRGTKFRLGQLRSEALLLENVVTCRDLHALKFKFVSRSTYLQKP